MRYLPATVTEPDIFEAIPDSFQYVGKIEKKRLLYMLAETIQGFTLREIQKCILERTKIGLCFYNIRMDLLNFMNV